MNSSSAIYTDQAALNPGATFALSQSKVSCTSELLSELRLALGTDHVHTDFPNLLCYSRDRLPWATFQVRRGKVPVALPEAIVSPANHDEVCTVLRLANLHGVPVIAFGAGSGVLGGTLPLGGEIILDLKRLNQIIGWHEEDGMVDVQAGMNGGEFERQLNIRGFMCGHYPQSMRMSTVGGWAACRGAGQESTRYGKIEHLIRGMRVALADGSDLEVRAGPPRAVGPSLQDLMVGSEGTLGVITSLSLRLIPKPACKKSLVMGFTNLGQALQAGRKILQSELRPAIYRLHDAPESQTKISKFEEFSEHPILCLMEFHGDLRLVDTEMAMALEIALHHGAKTGPQRPFDDWLSHRFQSHSTKAQAEDYYQDTIEVSAPWSKLEAMHKAMGIAVSELHPELYFGTHWSHAYLEGACQYMTFRLPPMSDDIAMNIHARLWEIINRLCLAHGGSISHHHGVGYFRSRWFAQDLGEGGMDVLRKIKKALDPNSILNPGKLGL